MNSTPESDAGSGMSHWLVSLMTPKDDHSPGVGLLRDRARSQMTLHIGLLQVVVEPTEQY